MGYWQSKVLPKIKKVFENRNTSVKKAAAAEACKSFDESKEDYSKQFEEKKDELQPKVVEIYEASSAEIKTLVKERKEGGLKKYSAAVHTFLEQLEKIDFPGSKPVSEASSKYGPAYVSGPVFFVFEKVSTFILVEEKVDPPPAAPETTATATATKTEEETSAAVKEREIVVEEEKKEEVVEIKKDEEVVEIKKDEEVVEAKKEEVVVEVKKEEEVEKAKPTEPEPPSEAPKVEEAAAAEPAKP